MTLHVIPTLRTLIKREIPHVDTMFCVAFAVFHSFVRSFGSTLLHFRRVLWTTFRRSPRGCVFAGGGVDSGDWLVVGGGDCDVTPLCPR